MSSFTEDHSDDDYSENENYSYDKIREPDKPKTDTLLPTSKDYVNNLNKDNYNEELYLKQALEESLKNAEDEYIALQLEQIKNEEDLINLTLKESEEVHENEKVMEEILKLSLLESKKEERYKSLENILYQFIKLRKIDTNFNENLVVLEEILKKYVNCEIENYEIKLEIYKNIFDQIKNIRIKVDELNLIKDILIVKH